MRNNKDINQRIESIYAITTIKNLKFKYWNACDLKKPDEILSCFCKDDVYIDFEDFGIEFDNYYTTHSEENREYSEFIYNSLKDNGDIKSQEIEQFYDESAKMFLPDRYIKGICPKCGAEDQYGDACEECGATYSPTELKKPISIISNTKPSTKKTEHFFFKLSNYTGPYNCLI